MLNDCKLALLAVPNLNSPVEFPVSDSTQIPAAPFPVPALDSLKNSTPALLPSPELSTRILPWSPYDTTDKSDVGLSVPMPTDPAK